MFYIEGNNTLNHLNKRKDNSLEYCIALKQKEYFKDYEIYQLEEENICFLYQKSIRRIFSEQGLSMRRVYARHLNNSYPHIDDVYLTENMRLLEERDFLKANWNIVNEFKKDLENTHSLSFSKTIKDKNNEEYEIKIFNNVDTNISTPAFNDILVIEKNGNKVGDMTVVYTDKHLVDTISNSIESLQLRSANYRFPFFDNKEDVIEYGKMNGVSIKKTDIVEKKEQIDLDYAKSLMNKSFSEYTCVDYDEDLSGLGLGKQMYFYMAQHLNKKNILFYSSILLSGAAEGLWNSMNKSFNGLVTKGKIFEDEGETERYCLSVPENLSFDSIMKPKHKTKHKNRNKI